MKIRQYFRKHLVSKELNDDRTRDMSRYTARRDLVCVPAFGEGCTNF